MLRYFNLLFLLIVSFAAVAQTKVTPVFGTFNDTRDKKAYRTVTIGNQTWFGYNLNYNSANSWCYDDSLDYCKTYGRLYTQEAARTACPSGWHLPSSDEWLTLITKLGGKSVAGNYLKEAGLDHWKHPNENATNASGFKALPAGYWDALSNSFFRIAEESVFWSSTLLNNNENYSWSFFLQYSSGSAFTENVTLSNNKNGYSVRCIKNAVIAPKI